MYKILGKNTPHQSVYLENADGSIVSFPFDPDNTDYQQYLKWLSEGNTPESADQQGAQ